MDSGGRINIFKKYMKYFLVFMLISLNLFAFQKSIDGKLKIIKQKQILLTKNADSLKGELDKLKSRINENEIRHESVNSLVATSNNYLSFAGWVGIAITVFLFLIGLFSIFSFKSEKREIEKHLKESKLDVDEAKKQFDDFISSPQKIQKTIENISYKEIIDGLNSEEERIFTSNIARAYNLSFNKRGEIVSQIKSKLFDPNYFESFYQIYHFMKQNQEIKVQDFAYKIWKDFNGKIPNNGSHFIGMDIFSAKPFPIAPFSFIQELISTSNKNIIYSVINKLDSEELISLFEKSVLANLDIEYHSFLRELKNTSFNVTTFVADCLSSINEATFKNIYNDLDYNEVIVKYRLGINNNLGENVDNYIRKAITGPNEFSFLANQSNLSDKKTWIELFNFHLTDDPSNYKEIVLSDCFEKMKGDLPSTDFFAKDLPLLLIKNYGIKIANNKYYYHEKELIPTIETNMWSSHPYSVVIHPVLNKKIETDSIK